MVDMSSSKNLDNLVIKYDVASEFIVNSANTTYNRYTT